MKIKPLIELIILAGLWGASFLFMRISVPEFGAVSMMAVRVALAGVILLPLAITTGSLLVAAIVLTPFAIYWWPAQAPTSNGWLNVVILAVACTAIAQIIFFQLIESSGATSATSVTFLIPVFGLLWGKLFLDENFDINTLIAGAVILVGTGMTTGIIKFSLKRRAQTEKKLKTQNSE